METEATGLRDRNAYNVTAMNVTPTELAAEIRKHIPTFMIDYQTDPVRQAIADSWPCSIDDKAAREDWGFEPRYDLAGMVTDMLAKLGKKIRSTRAD